MCQKIYKGNKMISSKLSIILIFLGLTSMVYTEGIAPKVKTPLGGIQGYYKISADGRSYEAYEGIPYAIPPVGKLRFKPPQKIPAWPGELLATTFGSPCLQYIQIITEFEDRIQGSEDCLYLNVYVPTRDHKNSQLPLLPVIFWIHGGAFQFGSGMHMGPKFVMDRDVIFVTINYRLGLLGFLSTEDDVLPGNMGLKDQNIALKWVFENIEWFGGDPNKITLTGLSAGGASVHYHYLSRLSSGLFQGGISISGTAFDCWTQTENSLEKAKKLGAIVGCPTNNTRDMVHCLRYRPGKTLVHATREFHPWLYNPFTPFGPVIEKHGDAPFIDQSPIDIIQSGNVQDIPWITSTTSEEGLYPVAEFIADDRHLKELDENWNSIAPYFLDFNYTIPKEKHVETATLIRNHYFGSKHINKTTIKSLIQMAGDRLFVFDSIKAARIQAKVNKQPVWYYYFTYRGAHSLSEAMSGSKENFGVSHADDAFLVLDTPYFNPVTTRDDIDMQQELINLWVSFAINSIPQIGITEWTAVDPSQKEFRFLHIAGPGKYYMSNDANLKNQDFWNNINFNENMSKRKKHLKEDL
ncbi:venom carboxylesterase-6-like [Vespa crabro]|uniref:venom carboxylesterase-6-like n=1 Tax=Vespa crabro TaxID=7445 RepID=UPI001F02FF0C|nr:venom carboxylesterase-6-like [Vespa crabro]XP_046828979.1 venom carboxylesterase-6-like [Vespa crabro]